MQKERSRSYQMTGPEVMYSGKGHIYNYDIAYKNKVYVQEYLSHDVVRNFTRKIATTTKEQAIRATLTGESTQTRLLDLGSGEGYESQAFRDLLPDTSVISMDMSHEGCQMAQDRYGLTPVVGNAHMLPFADASFAAVHCKDIMVHIDDKELMLSHVHRILETGGHFLLVSALKAYPEFQQIPWSVDDFVIQASEQGLVLQSYRETRLHMEDWYRGTKPKRAFMLFQKV